MDTLLADSETLQELRRKHAPLRHREEEASCSCGESECDALRLLFIVDRLWQIIGSKRTEIEGLANRLEAMTEQHAS